MWSLRRFLRIFFYHFIFILIFFFYFHFNFNLFCFIFILFIFYVYYFRLSLAIPSEGDGYSKCSMYAVNFTEKLLSGVVKSDPSWPVQSCKSGWEYNFTEIPYSTIATEVCCALIILENFELKIFHRSLTGSAITRTCRRYRNRFSFSALFSVAFFSVGLRIVTEEFPR